MSHAATSFRILSEQAGNALVATVRTQRHQHGIEQNQDGGAESQLPQEEVGG